MNTRSSQPERARLSDKIFEAFIIALNQRDVAIAELLSRAIELSITRSAGGGEFVERRTYPADLEAALARLDALKREQGFVMR